MSRDLFSGLPDDEPLSSFSVPTEHADAVELEMVLHYDTGKAILVSETGDETKAVWLPSAQIESNRTGKMVPGTKKNGERATLPVVKVSMREWLAKDKGLI